MYELMLIILTEKSPLGPPALVEDQKGTHGVPQTPVAMGQIVLPNPKGFQRQTALEEYLTLNISKQPAKARVYVKQVSCTVTIRPI